ncbi:alpha-amlyase [Flavobacterium sp. GSP27]|uniref:Alpha-amlyase n=1 Tax=Flavobacterium bomense TaxID=2497483 RepID=A0A3S0V050_9FLAO|nr:MULTISPECIES: alpha-amylase family glycosyl hydrolase [Flavobacterium]RTY96110.1 alpha-amlyase [Flavobacterium sp. GSN2]RTY71529.1 alpha-amlyase [Flavobacterium sp. LB2P53]RTY76600.1 alpha-amlyase [Flavobacterium sp. LS1R10]RTY84140.1 alpha-amlyase [Flavobacterium sp. LS1P28]RTY92886.1 alpha-amlyase [Flavobacterium sp. RSP46]
MKKKSLLLILSVLAFCVSCSGTKPVTENNTPIKKTKKTPFVWEGANVYFLMTDRFNNGDRSNDITLNRTKTTGKLRGFEGGDIKGITKKIEEGYFDKLGINAIWFTPVVEQIHDAVDEGTGLSYGYHGYWAKDWTALDPNFGTKKELAELVKKAHARGIRIILDGVINHTGPVTEIDTVWPNYWVRTNPVCDYKNYQNTTTCTLVANLPDIRTESTQNVDLPPFLVEKWKKEGRYEQEMNELDAFFSRTGYPKTPKYYIIKWLTDYVADYGIDGYRGDTVKHTDETVWADFKTQCDYSFETWKKKNPTKVLDNNSFYTIAEVYNYGISGGQDFDFGDKKINYFKNGFNNMINFEFKWDAQKDYEFIFSKYSDKLNTDLKGYSVLNYLSSHDDGAPFDAKRTKSIEAGTKLLLSPGLSQVYYGDESARPLVIEGTNGDATLRSFMNWKDIKSNPETKKILTHWRKLGKFRKNHPAVGAGIHTMISDTPYTFSRTYTKGTFTDKIVVGLDLSTGKKEIIVAPIFEDGSRVRDAYSGKEAKVSKGKVTIRTDFDIVLLEMRIKG